jgi:hypothetical protein
MGQIGSVENIVFGLCNVSIGGVNLGFSKGGTEAIITQSVVEATIDDAGDVPVALYDKGTMIEVVVNMVEYADLDKIALAFPTATIRADRITFGRQAGSVISSGVLIIDPLDSKGHNITIYKAAPVGEATLGYNNDDLRVFTARFKGLYDSSRSEGDRVFRIGGPNS